MSRRGDLLRMLTVAFPPPPDLEASMHSLYGEPDRIAAIMAAAMVEAVLERLIRAKFKFHSKVRGQVLFGQNGPLSTFSGKIHIAVAFGIITEQTGEELVHLKNIRNVFAHASINVDFTTPEIAEESHNFRMLEAVRNVSSINEAPHIDSFTGKSGYILVAVILSIMMDGEIRKAGGVPVYGRAVSAQGSETSPDE